MARVLKILGQVSPSAATMTDLYTSPALTETVVSSLTICNRSGTATSFRVAIRPAGAVLSNEQYVYYDVTLAGNDTFIATVGFTLEATDVVSVYATLGTLSFHLYGQEIS